MESLTKKPSYHNTPPIPNGAEEAKGVDLGEVLELKVLEKPYNHPVRKYPTNTLVSRIERLLSAYYPVNGCCAHGNMGSSIQVQPFPPSSIDRILRSSNSTMVSGLVSGGPVSLVYGFLCTLQK